jgi:hypothetical protein
VLTGRSIQSPSSFPSPMRSNHAPHDNRSLNVPPFSINPSPNKNLDLLGRQSSTLRVPANELGAELWKSKCWVMTSQLSPSNGERFSLIKINGVLFVVLKCRSLHKRHRPPPDRTSGLSFDTALYLMTTQTNTEIPDEQIKRTKREKNRYSQTSRLENRRSLSYTTTTKISCFDYSDALCTI